MAPEPAPPRQRTQASPFLATSPFVKSSPAASLRSSRKPSLSEAASSLLLSPYDLPIPHTVARIIIWGCLFLFVYFVTRERIALNGPCFDRERPEMPDFDPKPQIMEATGHHTATMILLHGLTGTTQQMMPAARGLSQQFPHIRFILPQAQVLSASVIDCSC